MKKKSKRYVDIIIALISLILISVIIAVFIFVNIKKKPQNNIYYQSVSIRKISNQYYIDGYIINKSNLYYEDLYVVFKIKDNDSNDYEYIYPTGEALTEKVYFKVNVTSEDFMSSTNPEIKEVYIKNGFYGNTMQIYTQLKLVKMTPIIYAPAYSVLFITVLLIIGLLVTFNFYSKYKTELHSVSISIGNQIKNNQKSKLKCSFCGTIINENTNICPNCGANLLRK